MRVPDPKANSTIEAYLAYKAGYLEQSELKPVLYEPYLHFDGWLAYWAGLTNTYPTDKNDNPEMLTDEEALVAYLSGVTDTYPEEIKDPYDVRIVGYLRHLASIRWPEPDYPVNNEEFYLSTMEPTHTSNPEPNTDIELDTAEGKIISVEAYGDSFQQTYSGKNIINFATISYSGANNGSGTRDGATFTVTGASNGNFGGIQFAQLNLQLKTDTTYTISATVVSTTNTDGSMVYVNSAMSNTGSQIYGSNAKAGGRTVATFTTPSSITNSASLRLYPGIADGVAVFTDIMIEESATATSYEPYVGGIPAPNPDYPQDIQVVTGEQTVEVRGKNLIDPTNLSFVYSNSPTQIELSSLSDGIRMVNNGGASQGRFAVFRSIDLTPYIGKVVRMKATFGASGGIRLQRIASDGSNRVQMAATTVSDTEISFTVPDDLGTSPYLGYVLDVIVGGGTTVDFTNLIATVDFSIEPYEPFQSQSCTISLGSIELCKLGDYQDYIYKSGDDWYLHKVCEKYIFTGNEPWALRNTTADGVSTFSWTFADMPVYAHVDDAVNASKCSYLNNHGRVTNINQMFFSFIGFAFYNRADTPNSSSFYANIKDADLDTFKSSVAGELLYYVLATPTDTKITDATLVGQLDALAGANTYNEKTYIKVTATDPNLPALLKVEAYKY